MCQIVILKSMTLSIESCEFFSKTGVISRNQFNGTRLEVRMFVFLIKSAEDMKILRIALTTAALFLS